MPKVKSRFDRICQFYYQIDVREGSKFYEIVQTAHKERLDIMQALRERDTKALEKLAEKIATLESFSRTIYHFIAQK